MDVTFFQTSDPYAYAAMLDQTARTVKLYCQRHGYNYESYVGLKRGRKSWHATYNRIFIFGELIARGVRGWAIYLDADALVLDQGFDLDGLLSAHAGQAAIMAPSGVAQDWWDVNAGVMMLNLDHPDARDLVRRWRRRLDRVPAQLLDEAAPWPAGFDDQSLLQIALREKPGIRRRLHLADMHLINSPQASFIRQFLRLVGDLDTRVALIRQEVETILQAAG